MQSCGFSNEAVGNVIAGFVRCSRLPFFDVLGGCVPFHFSNLDGSGALGENDPPNGVPNVPVFLQLPVLRFRSPRFSCDFEGHAHTGAHGDVVISLLAKLLCQSNEAACTVHDCFVVDTDMHWPRSA